ncbi:MAG: hypothetical protein AB7F86_12775 [Bdellovibrionales bacterium]
MGWFLSIRFSSIVVFSALAATVLATFQACSGVGFGGGTNGSQKSGGEGFDGKPYWSYAECNGQIEISDKLIVAPDYREARQIKRDCQDLPDSVPVAMSEITFAKGNSRVLRKDGKVFDEQQNKSDQRITVSMCNSATGKNVESLIWSTSSGLLGEVKTESSRTGAISVEQPAAGQYASINGQANPFLVNEAGTIQYSFNGVSMQDSVNCAKQSLPGIVNLQSKSVEMTGSGTSYAAAINPTGAEHLIVVGLSIFRPGPCVNEIRDNAPGGGNVYKSAAFTTYSAGSGEIWYSANSRPGATQITVTTAGACAGINPALFLAEFSGIDIANPLTVAPITNDNQPSSALVSAPTVNTSAAPALIFSLLVLENDALNLVSSSGFTALPIEHGDAAAFKISHAAGSHTVSFQQNLSGVSGAASVVFNGAK